MGYGRLIVPLCRLLLHFLPSFPSFPSFNAHMKPFIIEENGQSKLSMPQQLYASILIRGNMKQSSYPDLFSNISTELMSVIGRPWSSLSKLWKISA